MASVVAKEPQCLVITGNTQARRVVVPVRTALPIRCMLFLAVTPDTPFLLSIQSYYIAFNMLECPYFLNFLIIFLYSSTPSISLFIDIILRFDCVSRCVLLHPLNDTSPGSTCTSLQSYQSDVLYCSLSLSLSATR